jgi:protein transport protein SEC24
VLVHPFAPLRYDEAPVPLVSNWTSGQSAFDPPSDQDGPPRCEKCRGYINPWVKFTDGGQRWACNLCGGVNTVPSAYYHQERPELLHGTVDFPVPQAYWAPQPEGSLVESATDRSAANLSAASDALSSTASDLLGGLQSSLGTTPSQTRGPSPAPNKDREKELRKLRRPRPLGRVFIIDVSGPSVQRGVVREVCEGLRKALYGQDAEDDDVIGSEERIAIVTVAENIGFWNLSVGLVVEQELISAYIAAAIIDGRVRSRRHVLPTDTWFPGRPCRIQVSFIPRLT